MTASPWWVLACGYLSRHFGSSLVCVGPPNGVGACLRLDLTRRWSSGEWESVWTPFSTRSSAGASSQREEHPGAIRNLFWALLRTPKFQPGLWYQLLCSKRITNHNTTKGNKDLHGSANNVYVHVHREKIIIHYIERMNYKGRDSHSQLTLSHPLSLSYLSQHITICPQHTPPKI